MPSRDGFTVMLIKIQSSVGSWMLLFCLLFSAMVGCGPGTSHAGTYVAEIKDSPHHHETALELNETGAGVWRLGDDEVSFSWQMKGDELRLLTKNGGVIVGSLDNEVIHVTLPGSKELFFKKVK